MTQVFLGLGSNLDRENNIRAGVKALQKIFGTLVISPLYESESVGFRGSNFYNLVASLQTNLSIAELADVLKKIEDEHGRSRTGPKYSPRTLDIDILTYGDFIGIEAGVVLPRDEITRNAFVLLPLTDIAPDQVHPQLQKTYADIWDAYDKNTQILWKINFVWPVEAKEEIVGLII